MLTRNSLNQIIPTVFAGLAIMLASGCCCTDSHTTPETISPCSTCEAAAPVVSNYVAPASDCGCGCSAGGSEVQYSPSVSNGQTITSGMQSQSVGTVQSPATQNGSYYIGQPAATSSTTSSGFTPSYGGSASRSKAGSSLRGNLLP